MGRNIGTRNILFFSLRKVILWKCNNSVHSMSVTKRRKGRARDGGNWRSVPDPVEPLPFS